MLVSYEEKDALRSSADQLLGIFKKIFISKYSDRLWRKSGQTFAFMSFNNIEKTVASFNCSLNDTYISVNDDD